MTKVYLETKSQLVSLVQLVISFGLVELGELLFGTYGPEGGSN